MTGHLYYEILVLQVSFSFWLTTEKGCLTTSWLRIAIKVPKKQTRDYNSFVKNLGNGFQIYFSQGGM